MSPSSRAKTPLTTPVQFWETERRGRDREDKPEYKVKLSAARSASRTRCSASNTITTPRGSSTAAAPKRRSQTAFVYAIDAYLKDNSKYQKNESKHHLAGRAGLPDPCLQQLLHADELREPDEKGHHKQVRAGGDDGLSRSQPGGLFHREPASTPHKIAEQVLINKQQPRERGKGSA